MGEGDEPIRSDPMADAPSPPEGVPLARPIAVPYARPARPPPREILLVRSTRLAALADVGIAMAALVAFEVVTGLVILIGVAWIGGAPDLMDPQLERALTVPGIAVRAVGTILIVVAILALRRQSARSVGLTRSGVGLDLLFGLGGVYVVYMLLFSTMLPLWFLAPGVRDQMGENAERLMKLIPRLTPMGFAAVAMLVGFYEELLFRGFLMTRLRRATGSWTLAVLISTAVFTALHALDQTAPALLMITMLSIVFSLITIWRRSILPAIIAHALFDLSQFLLLYFSAGDSWT